MGGGSAGGMLLLVFVWSAVWCGLCSMFYVSIVCDQACGCVCVLLRLCRCVAAANNAPRVGSPSTSESRVITVTWNVG